MTQTQLTYSRPAKPRRSQGSQIINDSLHYTHDSALSFRPGCNHPTEQRNMRPLLRLDRSPSHNPPFAFAKIKIHSNYKENVTGKSKEDRHRESLYLCQSSQTRSFQDGCSSFCSRCVNIKMVSDANENNKGN